MKELPVVDPSRTEFGANRTICGCEDCTRYCSFVPGYMIPADLERMHQAIAPELSVDEFAKKHLWASPGATVMQAGKRFQVPTLVPARKEDGSCTFLTGDKRCSIHGVAPFGCAFFDSHQSTPDGDRLSSMGIMAIMRDNAERGPYHTLWKKLASLGLVAPTAEESKAKLDIAGRLPFKPESVEQLKARYQAALIHRFDAERVAENREIKPYQCPANLFDFEEGIRIVVSRELGALQPDQTTLHIVGIIQPGASVLKKLMKEPPRDRMTRFGNIAMARFREISGDKRKIIHHVVGETMVPHWFIKEED